MHRPTREALVDRVRCSAYTIPTDKPEADGTFAWTSTTLVLVEVTSGPVTGIGYTYSDASIVELIFSTLAPDVIGEDAWHIEALWNRMQRRVRNLGRSGLAATAISAIDCALWDLKAKLLDVPLVRLLGASRESVPIYGSGGFTTYADDETNQQLLRWTQEDGCQWVKMKVGSDPAKDAARVASARRAIGDTAGLFVDANGAYGVKTALQQAAQFAGLGVGWFEEPVSSDDLAGLRTVREGVAPCIDVAAGEYGFTLDEARHMLQAQAVDVMQADLTRCGGVTGFVRIAALCDAFHIPLSAHCAPALHLPAAMSVPRLRHQEWFHDHVRIESMLFDGAPVPHDGVIAPDLTRPGFGLEFRHHDARKFALDQGV